MFNMVTTYNCDNIENIITSLSSQFLNDLLYFKCLKLIFCIATTESLRNTLGSSGPVCFCWGGIQWWNGPFGHSNVSSTWYSPVSNFNRKYKPMNFRYVFILVWFDLIGNLRPRLPAGSIKLSTSLFGPSLKNSSMSNDAYKEAVLQAKEHILAGDIFQIVLSQRFERRTFADPFEVYRALRIVNPSPYMTYLQVCTPFKSLKW